MGIVRDKRFVWYEPSLRPPKIISPGVDSLRWPDTERVSTPKSQSRRSMNHQTKTVSTSWCLCLWVAVVTVVREVLRPLSGVTPPEGNPDHRWDRRDVVVSWFEGLKIPDFTPTFSLGTKLYVSRTGVWGSLNKKVTGLCQGTNIRYLLSKSPFPGTKF